MVTSIARQSIVIKCKLKESIMLGNYEFYYASGLLSRLSEVALPEDIKPPALHTWVHETIEKFEPSNGQEKHLVHMLRYYHPDEDHFDDHMVELLQMGKNEDHLWERFR